ncbi:FHA domain-containing protein [Verrucomicrobiota bacterium]
MQLRYKSGNQEKTHSFHQEWAIPIVTIGRGQQCALIVDDAKLSRVHSAIRHIDGFYILRDMNSHNGTFLNDKKIEFARLRPGDEITAGDTTFNVEE